jgi:phosphoribosylglycinamide formyltransferase 1
MSEGKNRIALFASGGGTNAEEIFKYFKDHPTIEAVLLLSNNPNAYALVRAEKYGVETKVFNKAQFRESAIVLDWLTEKNVTHIVLAGFMWLVPPYLIKSFPDRIVNIHPALLPNFGGKGMYGMFVHEAVKAADHKKTGITIHLVNEKYDDGRILAQESCGVESTDTPDDIANKVHQLEYQHYPRVIEKWILEK